MIRVVNIKNFDGKGEYIGRACYGKKASPLANDHKIGRDGGREEVLEKYWVDLLEKLADVESEQTKEMLRLKKILDDTGELILICWCVPLRCHGHIIATILENGIGGRK